MSVYLLTWNPKHFSTGGDGSESGTLNYSIGQEVRWSCHSQQPKVGDSIYLVRVGVEPRGIVAKGIVTKESYLAEHWSDETKQKRYIEFKLEGLGFDKECGLLPMVLLQGEMPQQKWSPQTSGIEVKQEYRETLTTLWEARIGQGQNEPSPHAMSNKMNKMMSNVISKPLNQVLYGPPGTGKTYHAVEAAVKAAEPEFYSGLGIDTIEGPTTKQRVYLQEKFKELSDLKRIRFVTFHQSYGYEEFVEGLSASSIDGQITYEVQSGIFKEICEQAGRGVEQTNDPLEIAIKAFKVELEEGTSLSLHTKRGKRFDVQYHGNTTFRAYPLESSHEDLGSGYPVSIDRIRKLYAGGDSKEFYNRSYIKAILRHLIHTYNLPEQPVAKIKGLKNFVLIIDEINRGNISKIFGELITLVEESKRAGEGQKECIEVVLPHSGESFSVPKNLHIIGTMNTADRSLAMMDTALRRRFDFVEMMPKPELFKGCFVKGIDIEQLLTVLNQRIEILYDREHMLGHAFFMPVKKILEEQGEDQAFEALELVFKNKIIPLLEEYFFEDWDKIRLVLADNQKANQPDLQFVKRVELKNTDLNSLFGSNHQLDQYGQTQVRYTLAKPEAAVWSTPNSYLGVYSAGESDIHTQVNDSDAVSTQ